MWWPRGEELTTLFLCLAVASCDSGYHCCFVLFTLFWTDYHYFAVISWLWALTLRLPLLLLAVTHLLLLDTIARQYFALLALCKSVAWWGGKGSLQHLRTENPQYFWHNGFRRRGYKLLGYTWNRRRVACSGRYAFHPLWGGEQQIHILMRSNIRTDSRLASSYYGTRHRRWPVAVWTPIVFNGCCLSHGHHSGYFLTSWKRLAY